MGLNSFDAFHVRSRREGMTTVLFNFHVFCLGDVLLSRTTSPNWLRMPYNHAFLYPFFSNYLLFILINYFSLINVSFG